MSVSHYHELLARAERQEDVDEAVASVRAEGLELSEEGVRRFAGVAAGEISTDELRERVLAHYRQ